MARAVVVAMIAFVVPAVTGDLAPADAASTVHAPGFALEPVFAGATVAGPASIAFAPHPDTRVFVAERRGIVKVFDSIYDPTPSIVYDIESDVHGYWDRGLLGIALDPDWPVSPWVYLLFTTDEGAQWPPLDGGSGSDWGSSCPNPPGATDDGCVVNGELARIRVNAGSSVTSTQTLLSGFWCQQYPSHSIGDLAFGADEYLYVSAGDGASFSFADYGQGGGDPEPGNRTPNNPCLDPDPTPGAANPPYAPNPAMTLPDAEGGALRSQDLLTAGDPISYSGSILRIDSDTGAAAPANPITTGSEARIVAHGLRNPYRITVRPGTNTLYVGDVGWGSREEINVITDAGGVIENFGWPCYEGTSKQSSYNGLDIDLCENLYTNPNYGGRSTLTAPFYSYGHGSNKPDDIGCAGNGASISGLAFEDGSAYPSAYDGALFFTDYSYRCTWVMFTSGGNPDPANIDTIVSDLGAVDLDLGPGDEIYVSEFTDGSVARFWRLTYAAGNDSPTASISASATNGVAPLTVTFNGSGSSDPNRDHLKYAWDTDDDGSFDDGSAVARQVTFDAPGTYDVRLRVQDFGGAADIDSVTITVVGPNDPPQAADDAYSVANGATLVVTAPDDVLQNDSDPNGDPLSAVLVDAPAHHSGPFTLDPAGTFTYVHDGTSGTQDTFTYRADDGEDTSNIATVTITIDNNPPVLDPIGDRSVDEESELTFVATGSDPNGDGLSWSLEPGTGPYPDGAVVGPSTGIFSWTPTEQQGPGTYTVVIRLTDDGTPSLSDTEEITISVAEVDLPPVVSIDEPGAALLWRVGDTIAFGATGDDPETGTLPPSAFDWTINLHHCETLGDCHIHPIETISGVDSGTTTAPDHEYPSYLEFVVRATDGTQQVSDRVEVQPHTVDLTFTSNPAGLTVTFGEHTGPAGFTRTVIAGSINSVSTPEVQSLGGRYYAFDEWADGATRIREITAPDDDATYKARFARPANRLRKVKRDLTALLASPPPSATAEELAALGSARRKVKRALVATLWTDNSTLDPVEGLEVFARSRIAVEKLRSIDPDGATHDAAQGAMWAIVDALDMAAAIAIGRAVDESAPAEDVSRAEIRRERAQRSIAASRPLVAVDRLQRSWRVATRYLL